MLRRYGNNFLQSVSGSTAVHNSDYTDCSTPVTSQLSLHTQQRYDPTSFVLKYGEKITGSPTVLHSVTCLYYCRGNRNIIVGIMTSYGVAVPEFESREGQELFLFFKTIQTCYVAHPSCYSVGTDFLSQG